MKLPYAIPALLLALACRTMPAAAQDSRIVETLLPAANLSAALTALATQSLKAGPDARQRTVFPLRLLRGQMQDLQRPKSLLRGAQPFSALQTGKAAPAMPEVNTGGAALNMDGIASDNTFAPPDPNGAVGATQYVQWVNTRMAVYNKASGALLAGPFPGNTVFADFSGSPGADACRTSNNGDPIVQYDKLAQRWLLTQLAWDPANFATGPYYQCIAVSASSDALGGYYRYVLDIRRPGNVIAFNDYPKVGVWPDAYYFTFVLFESTVGNFLGPRACGLDRPSMLTGAATIVRCTDFGTGFGVVLPSDLDGVTAPPPGSPNYLMSLDFTDDGHGDHLFLWRFSFSRSTITSAIEIPVAPFVIACPSLFGGPCIRQPAPGEALDALGDRLMHRLAYRNFGTRESLVLNHSVQQPGAPTDGPAAVRWYEIRDPNGAAGVYQQGNHMPDNKSRWMGSIAMDRMGNIALGYSVAGPTTAPGVRYTGRLRSEPLGRMENEEVLVNGAGVQVDTQNRWGDYSAMTIDPSGDCSFWYTQEYIAATGSFNWRTRIAKFAFSNCK